MQSTEHLHNHEHDHDHAHDHSPPLREWIKTALLLGLGLYFVYNIVSGNLTNYINIRFAWLSYVAAAIFLLLAAANGLRLVRGHSHDHDHDHQHSHDHDHSAISWAVLVIVAVPLVLGTMVPSRPLGAAAVDGDLSASNLGGSSAVSLSLAPEERNILDWVRALNIEPDHSVFYGQPVDVVGFVYRSPAHPDDQFLVARFTVSCCVADSTAIGLPVIWSEPVPTDSWVRVRGQMAAAEFQGEERTVIRPVSVEFVAQPDHPYLYP
jgi:uncharacterized repeat protein (TIGR03943 family)